MSFKFRPEDFELGQFGLRSQDMPKPSEIYAAQANRLLDEFVQTLPEIGGKIDLQFNAPTVWTPLGHNEGQVMRARLWGVEEIECQHKNTKIWEPHLAGARKCLDCGKVKYRASSTEWVVECEHEAECKSFLTSLPPQPVYTCKHCGKRLVAEWREED